MPKTAAKSSRKKSPRKWSAQVTETSHAMDLKPSVFTLRSPKQIAKSLKRSAQASTHRKTDPFRSAMSMLNFYINRAGKNLRATRKHTLEQAKSELRREFGRA